MPYARAAVVLLMMGRPYARAAVVLLMMGRPYARAAVVLVMMSRHALRTCSRGSSHWGVWNPRIFYRTNLLHIRGLVQKVGFGGERHYSVWQ